MKKLILSVTAIAGFSVASFAQGTITFDGSNNGNISSSATSGGQVFINGVADTTQDINAELLYSATPGGVFAPVVTLLLSSNDTGTGSPAVGQTLSAAGDVTTYGISTGQNLFYDNSGQAFIIPGVASGIAGYFEVMAWTGVGSTYANAADSVTTAVFSEVLSSSSAPTQVGVDQMPALNLVPATVVPEPSTLAMAGVGLVSMLIMRRKLS